jgi:hypothetical protein
VFHYLQTEKDIAAERMKRPCRPSGGVAPPLGVSQLGRRSEQEVTEPERAAPHGALTAKPCKSAIHSEPKNGSTRGLVGCRNSVTHCGLVS